MQPSQLLDQALLVRLCYLLLLDHSLVLQRPVLLHELLEVEELFVADCHAFVLSLLELLYAETRHTVVVTADQHRARLRKYACDVLGGTVAEGSRTSSRSCCKSSYHLSAAVSALP